MGVLPMFIGKRTISIEVSILTFMSFRQLPDSCAVFEGGRCCLENLKLSVRVFFFYQEVKTAMLNRCRHPGITLAIFFALSIALSGCGSASTADAGPSASAANSFNSTDVNLVFVVTPDLKNSNGDINEKTANLTNQGLRRAMKLAVWLRTSLLGSVDVKGIYALEPTSHLQTDANYPDLVPLEFIEQFAMVNQYSEFAPQTVTGSSFPVNLSYSQSSVPADAPVPASFPAGCRGIDYADRNGDNESLVSSIIAKNQSGFHVFAMPFDTFKGLLSGLRSQNAYDYTVPAAHEGPNVLYVLTVPPGGKAALASYDTGVVPGTAYPELNPPWKNSPSSYQTPFEIQTSNVSGSAPPSGINRNETVYFIRHGEAHPSSKWDDGNLVMEGNWRALYLPSALAAKIKTPDFVYAPDPSQLISHPWTDTYSYVRPSQTVAPYAIANGIPYNVASTFLYAVPGSTSESQAQITLQAANFFFTGGRFTGKTLLISWEHAHIPMIAQSLVNLYFAGSSSVPTVPPFTSWPDDDYDTIWTFNLDGNGNLTLDNHMCEGIDSKTLPSTAPAYCIKN